MMKFGSSRAQTDVPSLLLTERTIRFLILAIEGHSQYGPHWQKLRNLFTLLTQSLIPTLGVA